MVAHKKHFSPVFFLIVFLSISIAFPSNVLAKRFDRPTDNIEYIEDQCANNSFTDYDEEDNASCTDYTVDEVISQIPRFVSVVKNQSSDTYVASTTYDFTYLHSKELDAPAQTEYIDYDVHKVNLESSQLEFVATINSGVYNTFFGVSPNNVVYVLEALYDSGSNFNGVKISKLVNGSFQYYATVPKDFVRFKGQFYIDVNENIYLIGGVGQYDMFGDDTSNVIARVASNATFSKIFVSSDTDDRALGIVGSPDGNVFVSYTDIDHSDGYFYIGMKKLQNGTIVQYGQEFGVSDQYFTNLPEGTKTFIKNSNLLRLTFKLTNSFSHEYFEFKPQGDPEYFSLTDLIWSKLKKYDDISNPTYGITDITDLGQGRFYTIGNLYSPDATKVNVLYRLSKHNDTKEIFKTDRDFRVVRQDETTLLIFESKANSTGYKLKVLNVDEGEVEPQPEVGDTVPEDISFCTQAKNSPSTNFYFEANGRFFNAKIESKKLYLRSSADGVYGGINVNNGTQDEKEIFTMVDTNGMKEIVEVYLLKLSNRSPLAIVIRNGQKMMYLDVEGSGTIYEDWHVMKRFEQRRFDMQVKICNLKPMKGIKPIKRVVNPTSTRSRT